MISIVQRVTSARVLVDGALIGEIAAGMVVLVAIHREDSQADVEWTASKLAGMRIFRNGQQHFDRDIREVGGAILLVSNFTVAAATRKGRRPSFDAAAPPEAGSRLFDQLVEAVGRLGIPTATGRFGADMQVVLINDGPVTLIVDSRRQPGE
jgi:D-aminoacyl-tRNA deacylase